MSQILKIFFSYSHKDRVVVGKLKRALESYGLNIFVAHDDINPSLEWQRKIIRELEECHIFILLVTENFLSSKWVDQESGFALAKKKLIIPLSIGITPYGFLNKFQSLRIDPKRDDVIGVSRKILKVIKQNTRFNNLLLTPLINSLSKVGSFDQAGESFQKLYEFSFSKRQINELVKNSISNNQIYGSFTARPYLKDIVEKHVKLVNHDLLKSLEELTEEKFL